MIGQTYSDSTLVSRIFDGSSRCNERDVPIKRITIHHSAGKSTLDSLRNTMWDESRECSWNYGIAYTGDIGRYIPERYRAWTSSSRENDMQAVTIEAANAGYSEDPDYEWPVTDETYNSIIMLCTDICQRNNIPSLTYTGQLAGSNLTMHRWFKATGCPGPYLLERFPDIARRVNTNLVLGVTFSDVSPVVTSYSAAVTGAGVNYFAGQGINSVVTSNIKPYMITINRKSPVLDYNTLRYKGVVGVMIEGGCLYSRTHTEQSYRNPRVLTQCEAAAKAGLPRAIYSVVKARNETEAKKEINALMSLLYEVMPNLGVWLKLEFTSYSNKEMNDKILNLYKSKLESIGFRNRVGLYVPKSQLDRIDWSMHSSNLLLWLDNHISDSADLDEVLTPQFFVP